MRGIGGSYSSPLLKTEGSESSLLFPHHFYERHADHGHENEQPLYQHD